MEVIRAALARAVSGLAQDLVKPVVMAVIMWTIAAILFLVVIGFVVSGIYHAIEAPLGPVAASFIMAAIALVPAIVLIMVANSSIARIGAKPPTPVAPPVAPPRETTVEGLGNIAAAFAFGFAKGLGRRRKK